MTDDNNCESICSAIVDAPSGCCTIAATCLLSDVTLTDCTFPIALTDPASVFNFVACGNIPTLAHTDVGDTDFCTDGDGVNFTRTYTLTIDGQMYTCAVSYTHLTLPTILLV